MFSKGTWAAVPQALSAAGGTLLCLRFAELHAGSIAGVFLLEHHGLLSPSEADQWVQELGGAARLRTSAVGAEPRGSSCLREAKWDAEVVGQVVLLPYTSQGCWLLKSLLWRGRLSDNLYPSLNIPFLIPCWH